MCPNKMAPGAHSTLSSIPRNPRIFSYTAFLSGNFVPSPTLKFPARIQLGCEHLVSRMLSGLHPDLGDIGSLRVSEMSPSHETRWDGNYPSGIPSVQEHQCSWRCESIASSLLPLSCLCLLIILPWEGDTVGEKSCLASILGFKLSWVIVGGLGGDLV